MNAVLNAFKVPACLALLATITFATKIAYGSVPGPNELQFSQSEFELLLTLCTADETLYNCDNRWTEQIQALEKSSPVDTERMDLLLNSQKRIRFIYARIAGYYVLQPTERIIYKEICLEYSPALCLKVLEDSIKDADTPTEGRFLRGRLSRVRPLIERMIPAEAIEQKIVPDELLIIR